MISKSIIFAFLLSFCFSSYSQSNWKLLYTYKSDKVMSWDVDPMGKVILAENDVLKKLDTAFTEQFSQSSKRFGEISRIDARHSLKTLIFSENQQLVSFIDNTLTFQEAFKELASENISYATNVCYSGQTNRYWVYDADNSRLVLIDNSRLNKTEINNLSSITGASEPIGLFESHHQLFMLYKNKGIYIFDYYGSLIRFIDVPKATAMHVSEDYLYYLVENLLIRKNLKNQTEFSLILPEKEIIDFRIFGKYVFMQTPNGIKKYFLNQP